MTRLHATTLGAALLLAAAGTAQAGAVITNPAETLLMGINDHGALNFGSGITANGSSGAAGIAFKFPDGSFRDATSPGCLCEGWGVSVNGTHSGFANVSTDGGPNNLTFAPIVAGPNSATATTSLTSLPGLVVTQAYAPSANAPTALFVNHVTITNTTGATVDNVKYVRVMDWDVPPTEFDEYVTIRGTATTTLLEESGNNGFNTANPLAPYGNFDPACLDQDCIDSGIDDHGAYFRFNFGSLADGESYSFDIFYGAAPTERAALAAIGAEGLELFSLGQSSGVDEDGNPSQISGAPATYIFGFRGVGGEVVIPPGGTVPEPASIALLGLGLAGMGWSRRRKA